MCSQGNINIEMAIEVARLWEKGKMIGEDENDVRNALLHEVIRLRSLIGDRSTDNNMLINEAVKPVIDEVKRATEKFNTWPTDPLHAFGIVGEEHGELNKAILQAIYEPNKSTKEDVKEEAVQTAAMSIRFLMSLDKYSYDESMQHKQS